jgi:hypothetical protein
MPHELGKVQAEAAGIEVVEELAHRLPLHLDVPVGQQPTGVLDRRAVQIRDRRRAETAVAAHDGGHSLADERLDHGGVVRPGQEPVRMTVDVDEPGGQGLPRTVDRLLGIQSRELAQCRDSISGNRDIRAERGGPGPVDHGPTR